MNIKTSAGKNKAEVIGLDQNDFVYPSLEELPIGLGMALMQNKIAMDYFAALSDAGRQQIVDHTHNIQSKEEMQSFVDSIAKGNLAF